MESRYSLESGRRTSSPLRFRSSFEVRSADPRLAESYRPLGSPRAPISGSLLVDVQRQHDRTLDQVYTRMELGDRAYQAETASLQAQVSSLRQQLDLAAVSHARDVESLRKEYEEKIRSETISKETAVTALTAKAQETQHSTALESDRCAQLRREIIEEKERQGEVIGKLQTEQRSIQQELAYYQDQKLPSLQAELARLHDERERLEEDGNRAIALSREQHNRLITDLQTQIEAREARVRSLEYESADLRHQIKVKSEAYARDIATLQETLQSTKDVIDTQERNIARLRLERTEARQDSKELAREVATFHREVTQAKSEHLSLKSDTRKLERLVYGKGSRRPASAKAKPTKA